MPIEFRCPQCSKLLRVPDDAAGKQARCPSCGAVVDVPAPRRPPTALPEAGAGQAGSPFAPAASPLGPDDLENPYRSPLGGGAVMEQIAPGEIRPTIIDIGAVLSQSWAIYQVHWGMCTLAVFLALVIQQAYSVLFQVVVAVADMVVDSPVVIIVAVIVAQIGAMLLNAWIWGGLTVFMLKTARAQPASISDLFSSTEQVWPLFCGSVLFSLVVGAGALLCFVPGVILALMFSQYWTLIVDRRERVLDAFSLSKQLTDGNKGSLFVVVLLYLGLGFIGLCACFVGMFFAMSFYLLVMVVAYLNMSGQAVAVPGAAAPAA